MGGAVITEGIEDAASFALATGWTAWAAGSGDRIPPIVAAARGFDPICIAFDDDEPVPVFNFERRRIGWRPGTGRRARDRSLEIRPDLAAIEIGRIFQRKTDANRLLQVYGPETLLACVGWSVAQNRFRLGRIGFAEMQREIAEAEGVFRLILPLL